MGYNILLSFFVGAFAAMAVIQAFAGDWLAALYMAVATGITVRARLDRKAVG